MRRTTLWLISLLLPIAALAHHAPAIFDQTKTIVIEGTVTEFVWQFPHSWIRMDVAEDNGATRNWSTIKARSVSARMIHAQVGTDVVSGASSTGRHRARLITTTAIRPSTVATRPRILRARVGRASDLAGESAVSRVVMSSLSFQNQGGTLVDPTCSEQDHHQVHGHWR